MSTLSIIPELTKDCKREDCRIGGGNVWARSPVARSLVMYEPQYDKRGVRIDHPDLNTSTSFYSCAICGGSWTVEYRGNARTINSVPPKDGGEA